MPGALRRLGPWWLGGMAVPLASGAWVYIQTWPGLVIDVLLSIAATVALLYVGLCRALGYRPATVGDVGVHELVHLTSCAHHCVGPSVPRGVRGPARVCQDLARTRLGRVPPR